MFKTKELCNRRFLVQGTCDPLIKGPVPHNISRYSNDEHSAERQESTAVTTEPQLLFQDVWAKRLLQEGCSSLAQGELYRRQWTAVETFGSMLIKALEGMAISMCVDCAAISTVHLLLLNQCCDPLGALRPMSPSS